MTNNHGCQQAVDWRLFLRKRQGVRADMPVTTPVLGRYLWRADIMGPCAGVPGTARVQRQPAATSGRMQRRLGALFVFSTLLLPIAIVLRLPIAGSCMPDSAC